MLFWIAATNFVFPTLFSLAQIVIVYREVDIIVINDIVLVNTSIAVIGVVFATVWAGSSRWAEDRNHNEVHPPPTGPLRSALVFGDRRTTTTNVGTLSGVGSRSSDSAIREVPLFGVQDKESKAESKEETDEKKSYPTDEIV